MTYPRSPFDRSVAGTLHWARFIDKVRQNLAGQLPDEFAAALGHPRGVDGQFLGHFELDLEHITTAVAGKNDDDELAAWLERVVEDFPSKKDTWNTLAPNLGKAGYPMERTLKIVITRLYKGIDLSPGMGVFELIELDEGRT